MVTALVCGSLILPGLTFVAGGHGPMRLSPEGQKVVSTPVISTDVTVSGQPIVLPQSAQLVVTTLEIAPGAALPEHRHKYQRYGYMLAGQLQVTNDETGKVETFKPGDFIVESLGQWHHAATQGNETVKLLVIDQVEKGQGNVEIKK
ncbi:MULTISPECIES: cupin domain-containing protein [Rhodomicrobium]|uniref:cupin domain-containing protein n=1 Tax=Rhodomicrobium TaxID=1068 RepID=UPI001FDA5675|nr:MULTISPECIES: cupin domain-containing protein [Rhodomicrobium]